MYAASASTKPQPKWLFGTWSMPPHCVPLLTVMMVGLAVFDRSAFVAAMSRTSAGRADHSRATTPTTWGPAIEVPLQVFPLYCVSLPFSAEFTLTPGAAMSGLIRLEPSIVTGPRLLKPARAFVPALIAPVE